MMLSRQIALQARKQIARPAIARALMVRPAMMPLRAYSTEPPAEPPVLKEVREMLKTAMRSGDNTAKTTIRAVMAGVKNANIDKPGSMSTDFAFHSLVGTLIRKRQSSAEEYTKAGREDLAEKERSEISVLEKLQEKVPIASPDEVRSRLELFIAANRIDRSAKNFMQQMMAKVPWATAETQWGMPKKEIVLLIKEMAKRD